MDILGLPGELVALLLGWLLGLLSLPLGDKIREARLRTRLATAIKAEMIEMRYTMALVADNMKDATGTRDAEFLRWLEVTVSEYRGVDPDQPAFLQALRQLLKAAPGGVPSKKSGAMILKKYSLPFLEANAAELAMCSVPFQQSALQVKAQLELFNSEVDFLMQQYQLTFDPALSAPNHASVQSNLKAGYAKQGRFAMRIADLIAAIEKIEPK